MSRLSLDSYLGVRQLLFPGVICLSPPWYFWPDDLAVDPVSSEFLVIRLGEWRTMRVLPTARADTRVELIYPIIV